MVLEVAAEDKGSPDSVIVLSSWLNVMEGIAKLVVIVPNEPSHASPRTTSAPSMGITNNGILNGEFDSTMLTSGHRLLQ